MDGWREKEEEGGGASLTYNEDVIKLSLAAPSLLPTDTCPHSDLPTPPQNPKHTHNTFTHSVPSAFRRQAPDHQHNGCFPPSQ